MTINDEVPGGIPATAITAITAGITNMGAPNLDVIVTTDFVTTVRTLTGDDSYHADRNGGTVAARTIPTTNDDCVVVANWDVFRALTPADIERIAAHEAAHAAISDRKEHVDTDLDELYPNNYWNFQTAYGAGIGIEEYRCEAAVYRAGYPVQSSRSDDDIANNLFGLNLELLAANSKYQEHLDVAQLRDDVLSTLLLNVRYMGCVAARHLHHDNIDPKNLNKFAAANWKTLIAPTWGEFLNLYASIPDALTPWPDPAGVQAVTATVPLIHDLAKSFGFKASTDSAGNEKFNITMTSQTFEIRRQRANAEAPLHGITT